MGCQVFTSLESRQMHGGRSLEGMITHSCFSAGEGAAEEAAAPVCSAGSSSEAPQDRSAPLPPHPLSKAGPRKAGFKHLLCGARKLGRQPGKIQTGVVPAARV